jgi:hypothetical protein
MRRREFPWRPIFFHGEPMSAIFFGLVLAVAG